MIAAEVIHRNKSLVKAWLKENYTIPNRTVAEADVLFREWCQERLGIKFSLRYLSEIARREGWWPRRRSLRSDKKPVTTRTRFAAAAKKVTKKATSTTINVALARTILKETSLDYKTRVEVASKLLA